MTWMHAMSRLNRLRTRREISSDETHLSAESTPSKEGSRIPRADEDPGWPKGAQAAAREGTETADRLTGRFPRTERLTRGADIQALFRGGRRVERPSVIALWGATDKPRRAGFAVTRQIRGSVCRNRAKRRLREAYRATRHAAPDHVDIMLIAKRGALDGAFATLREHVQEVLAMIPGSRVPS